MQERRRHRRIPLRLSVTCRKAGGPDEKKYAGSTINVSPGGMLIEMREIEIAAGQVLTVEMIVPPTEGLLEFGGSFSIYARVLRRGQAANPVSRSESVYSLAVEFCQPPRFRV